MSTYNVTATAITINNSNSSGKLLKIGFGTPAQNDAIVRDAKASLEALALQGGEIALLNGPASLPAACVIAHGVCHKFGAVGVFDPKMGGYVISITHNPTFALGQVIPATEVKEV